MNKITSIIATTIVLYIFGSVCNGTLNIGEWDRFGRVLIAVVWLLSTIDDLDEK